MFIINESVSADWLLDRRHCNLKWQNAVKDIREKINSAIQDMPENEEIKQLLSGSCKIFTLPYFNSIYCNCFQRCLLNCLTFINRHSLLPLLEDCGDPQKD